MAVEVVAAPHGAEHSGRIEQRFDARLRHYIPVNRDGVPDIEVQEDLR